jgi:hypothetical protein
MPFTASHTGGRGHTRAAERCVGILDWVARRAGARPRSPGPSLSPGADGSREEFVRVPVELLTKKRRVSAWRPVPRAERPSLSRAERSPLTDEMSAGRG